MSGVLDHGTLTVTDSPDSDGVGAEAAGAAGDFDDGPGFFDLLDGPAGQGPRAALGADILHLLEEAGTRLESLSLNRDGFRLKLRLLMWILLAVTGREGVSVMRYMSVCSLRGCWVSLEP